MISEQYCTIIVFFCRSLSHGNAEEKKKEGEKLKREKQEKGRLGKERLEKKREENKKKRIDEERQREAEKQKSEDRERQDTRRREEKEIVQEEFTAIISGGSNEPRTVSSFPSPSSSALTSTSPPIDKNENAKYQELLQQLRYTPSTPDEDG